MGPDAAAFLDRMYTNRMSTLAVGSIRYGFMLGLDGMVYVHVRLSSQGRDALAQFERAIRDRPEVLDCCTLTGEWDFHLRIVTHDIKEYEAFFLDHLSKIPNVQSVNSSIVVTVIKESTALPLARE